MTLGACSATAPRTATPSPPVASAHDDSIVPTTDIVESDALRAALAGGDVDYDTYKAGYRRFSECMRAAGFPLFSESESNLVMKYSVVVGSAEATCYGSEFEPLDIAWQVHQADTSETAEIFRQCLTQRGIVPDATLVGMDQQLVDEGIPVEDCLEPRE